MQSQGLRWNLQKLFIKLEAKRLRRRGSAPHLTSKPVTPSHFTLARPQPGPDTPPTQLTTRQTQAKSTAPLPTTRANRPPPPGRPRASSDDSLDQSARARSAALTTTNRRVSRPQAKMIVARHDDQPGHDQPSYYSKGCMAANLRSSLPQEGINSTRYPNSNLKPLSTNPNPLAAPLHNKIKPQSHSFPTTMPQANRTIQTTPQDTQMADRVEVCGGIYIQECLTHQHFGQNNSPTNCLPARPSAGPYFFPINLRTGSSLGATHQIQGAHTIRGSILGLSADSRLEMNFTCGTTDERRPRKLSNEEAPLLVNAVGTICKLSITNILSGEPTCAITLEHETPVSRTTNTDSKQLANSPHQNLPSKLVIDYLIPAEIASIFALDADHIGLRAWFYGNLAGVNATKGRAIVQVISGRVFGVKK
ncbi:hypothetical protein PTTG_27929 [Puccinia triticina 1-1 BBBD Race 1]|uniref:Uncharacterized protein n=1 Tax=Puccinia triticina (isolate 1-1 / race 1 (BBBD)) TaxID=630390 RepID=A0A180GGA8_PUCT1|nr:hypothetical protein PTTG_27929 [Puccinia triticina 1-1 BBBD Race 1]